MGKTYGMQERNNTCKEIFGTNIMGIIEHNIIINLLKLEVAMAWR